jgi:hypothetical protein
MKKKVMFIFAGTGDPGDKTSADCERLTPYEEDVIRVYFAGCENRNIGGKDYLSGMISPDLSVGVKKIAAAFDSEGKLDIKKLRENLGDGISKIAGFSSDENMLIEVERACLRGYSRGAVTAFAAAKELNHCGFPIDIVADQPVPGEASERSPLFTQYHDLSTCENIKSATTLLASHDLRNGLVHNGFFSQMVAKFPVKCSAQNILLPHQNHWDAHGFDMVTFRINIELERLKFIKKPRLSNYVDDLRNEYRLKKFTGYTPEKFAQKIFGAQGQSITKDPIYLEIVDTKAKELLAKFKIEVPEKLDPEKASAILAIEQEGINANGLGNSADDRLEKKIKLAMGDDDKSNRFRVIVNKVDETCDYLVATTKEPTIEIHVYNAPPPDETLPVDKSKFKHTKFNGKYIWDKKREELFYNRNGEVEKIEFVGRHQKAWFMGLFTGWQEGKNSIKLTAHSQESMLFCIQPHERVEKSNKIELKGKEFKNAVVNESYDYLVGKQDYEAQSTFVHKIKIAEKDFREGALNIDRSIWRQCMKGLVNFLSHATGIGMLLNVNNKIQTGNWFLYDKTRSATVVKETVKDVFKAVVPEAMDNFKKIKKFAQEQRAARASLTEGKGPHPSNRKPSEG